MQSRKKRYNIMLVGPKGIGKSTFLDTLMEKKITVDNDDLNAYEIEINSEGVNKTFNFLETPGFDLINNSEHITSLIYYLKQQYDLYLQEESKIIRDISYNDSRVHCLLYFIKPIVQGLKPYDIQILEQLTKYTNVIIFIAKSDAFRRGEMLECKRNVNKQLEELKIPVFNFEIFGKSYFSNRQKIGEYPPFALVANYMKKRQYNTFSISIEDTSFSDYVLIKEMLFGNHVDCFVDYTSHVLYEKYRSETLNALFTEKN